MTVVTRSAVMRYCDLVIDLMITPQFWASCVSDRGVTMEHAMTWLRAAPSKPCYSLYYPLPILHLTYMHFLQLLPSHQEVCIVSNHGDEYLEPHVLQVLAADPRIQGVYVNNVSVSFPGHPKVHYIPLGYCQDEYHHVSMGSMYATITLRNLPWVDTFVKNHPKINVLDCHPKRRLLDKPFKVLCAIGNTGSMRTSLTLRRDCTRYLQQQSFGLCPGFLEKKQYFQLHEDVMFEVSPWGNGLTNFREWEALLLHTIPIVFHSPVDGVYQDLPVLIVSKPEDITESLLTKTLNKWGTWFETHNIRQALDVKRWLGPIHNPQRT
jgi:hypothetical protein